MAHGSTYRTPAQGATGWLAASGHRRWLQHETDRLLDFYERSVLDPSGGFHWLDIDGHPLDGRPKYLWLTARMVHCFALAELLGRPGAERYVEHGLAFLDGPLRDRRHGGWFWSVGPHDRLVDDKQAYGHAFVLLAASTAAQAGHSAGDALAHDALAVLDERFWEPEHARYAECFSRDWAYCEPYRGANSHMHLTEALMAAAERSGERSLHERAAGIAERLIGDETARNGWRVPEHFDASWQVLPDYNKDHPDNEFRPYGSTIGHWLEWARLLVQLSRFDPASRTWMVDAAVTMFDKAIQEGWRQRGGFAFTVDSDGHPLSADRYHWVHAEAVGTAAYLYRITGNRSYAVWYRRFWDYIDRHLIDHGRGGWYHQLDASQRVITTVWDGKPDLYHALQATLFARVPDGLGIAAAICEGRLDKLSDIKGEGQ